MKNRNMLGLSVGALATGLLAIGAVTVVCRWTRTKEDAAIGIVLSTFFGAGVVLLTVVQQSASGNQAGLDRFLFGEPAGMLASDIRLLIGMAVFCLAVVVALYKEFQLLSFDTDFAAVQGWPTLALDLAMMSALAIVTVVGLPICGVILMAAMIILPSAAARFWTNHLGRLLVIAAVAGAAAGLIGTLVASPLPARWLGRDPHEFGFSHHTVPPGPLIVLTAAAFFIISVLFAPGRGALARLIAELRLRTRITREHLLRALYELSEPQLPARPQIAESQLVARRAWSAPPGRVVVAPRKIEWFGGTDKRQRPLNAGRTRRCRRSDANPPAVGIVPGRHCPASPATTSTVTPTTSSTYCPNR